LVTFSKRLATAAQQASVASVPAKQALGVSLISAIVDVGGLPRTQIKDALLDLLNPKKAACGHASCAQIYGIKQSGIDEFLDDLRTQVEQSASLKDADRLRTRQILMDSLERSSIHFQSIKKRSYTIAGESIDETAYLSHAPWSRGLEIISIEREVSWRSGGEVKRELYRGYAAYGIRDDILEVHLLDSLPEGKGTGSVLMKELAEEAKRLGKTRIHTLSTAHMAHDFYHKIGFRPEKGEVSQLAKNSPELYQSALDAARQTPGFDKKSRPEQEAIIDKALGSLTATWEASADTVLTNTKGIRYQ
jgi:GNAT superfamily N-acetyltransferase